MMNAEDKRPRGVRGPACSTIGEPQFGQYGILSTVALMEPPSGFLGYGCWRPAAAHGGLAGGIVR